MDKAENKQIPKYIIIKLKKKEEKAGAAPQTHEKGYIRKRVERAPT